MPGLFSMTIPDGYEFAHCVARGAVGDGRVSGEILETSKDLKYLLEKYGHRGDIIFMFTWVKKE